MKVEVVENQCEVGAGGDVDDGGLDPFLNESMEPMPSTSIGGGDTSPVISASHTQVLPEPAILASELTNAWNCSTNGGLKTATEEPSELKVNPQFRKNIKITCLLCCNLIFQRAEPEVEEDEVKTRRSKRLKNLCDLLHLNKEEIPDLCLKEMFPFCRGCRENSDKLWDLKKELDNIQKMIIGTLNDIKKKVADGEMLEHRIRKPKHPLVIEAERRKFIRLREMILEVCRESLVVNMSPRQDDISEEAPTHREVGVSTQDAELTVTTTPKEEVLDHDIHVDLPIPATNEKQNAMSQTLMRASRADDGHSSASTTLAAEAPGPSLTPAATPTASKKAKTTKKSPLKKNLPSTSSNGAVGAGGGDSLKRTRSAATSGVNMMPSILLYPLDAQLLMKMKKESLATALQAEQDSYNWESDDEDLFTITVKKKRQLFEGVEILRCVNPAKNEYLQCSVCCFTLQITKKYVKGNTPYQKMKAHINYCHINNGAANMSKPPPAIFECDFCAATFATRETFREHQQLHPEHQIPAQECDICHRPLKFSSTCNTNLLRHKFSHKNDEERRAALEAEEKGAFYAFLEKTEEEVKLPNKKRRMSHFSYKNKTAHVVIAKKTVADHQKSRFGHFECHLCNRSFPLRNGLALHIKAHLKKMNMQKSKLPSPPSSVTDVEVLKVKRIKKKNGRYENPPVLFPVSPQKKKRTIKTATQSSLKETEPSKKAVRAEEDVENPEPTSTEMQQQQEEDNDVVLPILKREVVEEEGIETDD